MVHPVVCGRLGHAKRRCHSSRRTAGDPPGREFLIIVALSAIGQSAELRRMACTGVRPILLGLGVLVAVAVSSLLVQMVTGRL